MANGWQRVNGKVYFYYSLDGKQHKVPRAQTKWLDNEPKHNIETERRRWGLANLKTGTQYEQLDNAATLDLVETFCVYLETRRKSPKTIQQHKHNLTRYCLPFFVQKEGLEHPQQWPTKSVRLLGHLQSSGVASRTINTCNVSMRVFWTWLVEEGKASGAMLLRNAIIGQEATPMNFTVTPDDILRRPYYSPEMRLLSLIGYFFSLRPQELVALRPSDFRAGSKAAELECCKVMDGAGLYGRFAVSISRQRAGNSFKLPKSNSKGWVACFDEAAAKEIVTMLRDARPDELLFKFRLDWWFKLWRTRGYPGMAMKDLRRASLYWLGHYSSLTFIALKNHARHSDPSTTSLYTRRPGHEQVEFADLDLDA